MVGRCLGICTGKKLCRCCDRGYRYAYRSTVPRITNIEKIQPGIMVTTFNGNPSTIIISCNSSTNVSNETDLIAFCNKLSSLVRSIPKHNVLIISGDMNAQISKNVNNKFSLFNSSNRHGKQLTDFTLENPIYPTPPLGQDMTQGQFLSGV